MKNGLRGFFREVQRCRICYGAHDILVPTPEPIPARVRVLVIGEQPCRVGAAEGRNGMDGTEEGSANLRSYIERAGIDPAEVLYVTAVLCVPKAADLRAGRPTATETRNCSRHLRALIDRVKPQLIVPLGHTGLLAAQFAFREWTELRQFILNYDIGAVLTRGEHTVYPLYLPSASTLKVRPDGRQLRDWQKVPLVLESLEKAARTG
jgi:DNA polymerase